VGNAKARGKSLKGVSKKACGSSPGLEDDAVGVPIERKTASSDNVSIACNDAAVNHRNSTQDVFDAKDGNLKCIGRLDVSRGSRTVSVMVNNRGKLDKMFDRSTVE